MPKIVIDNAKNWLIENCNPVAIILFGSRAKGNASSSSDYDFLIVVEDNHDDDFDISRLNVNNRAALTSAVNAECDTVFNSVSSFLESVQDVPREELPRGSFSYQAANEGILLYPNTTMQQLLASLRQRANL